VALPVQNLDDRRSRPLTDLRVSVTDRCNFRCRYCMPKEHFDKGHRFLPRAELLSFEEIARVARVLAGLGLRKVRLTGGEPLLRAELHRLIAMLAEIPSLDVALTTNGSLLAEKAVALASAGLRRVTVSLDALDPAIFRANTDTEYAVSDVLEGLDAAARAGLGPIKVNAVVRRGVNDGEILALARHFKGTPHIVRFIEYMDVGITNGWRLADVVPAQEIVSRISAVFPLEPVPPTHPGEVATRYVYRDGSGEIGVISSVTAPFCKTCTRLRLSSEGQLYTCLFATTGHDLRARLRSSMDDEAIAEFVRGIWVARDDRYSELRSERTRSLPRIEMSYIGG
jgi:cyclic pyranopterin phosphate synthase